MDIFDSSLDLPKDAGIDDLEKHYLDGIVLTRHHVYSTYNKNNDMAVAGKVLDSRVVDNDIDYLQCTGIDVELRFYHTFRPLFDLVPALDCGDHTDFVGVWKGKLVRFDVTSNASKKKDSLSNYLMRSNHIIVEWDKTKKRWRFFRPNLEESRLELKCSVAYESHQGDCVR